MTYDQLIIAQSVVSPLHRESLGNAVVIRNGRILAVGDKDDLMRSDQHIVDMGDAHLFPGFVESHAHLLWMAQSATHIDCGPETNHSIQDLLRRVQEATRQQPPRHLDSRGSLG